MATHQGSKRLRAALTMAVGTLMLAACSLPGAARHASREHSPGPGAVSARIRAADEHMPAAPLDETAWLHAVDTAYADVDGGRRAEGWLRYRMAHRHPGQRLAV